MSPDGQTGGGGPRLAPGELRRVMLWSVLVICVILTPYLLAYTVVGPENHVFMGSLLAVDEGQAYLQWSRQAMEGRWTFEDRYTTERDRGLFLNLLFLVWGRLARWLHTEPIWIMQATRLVAGWVFLVGVYLLAALLFERPTARWGAYLLAAFSSGLGWLQWLLFRHREIHSPDFGGGLSQPEAISFTCLYVNALFAGSLALLVLILFFFVWGYTTNRLRWTLLAALGMLLLGNVHSYDVLVVFPTVASYVLWTLLTGRKQWRDVWPHALVFFLAGLPGPGYAYYVTRVDPLYRAKAETVLRSAPVYGYLSAYGIPLLLAVLGALHVRRLRPAGMLLVFWLVVGFLAPFVPTSVIPFPRKLVEGYHLILCVLGGAALAYQIEPWLTERGWPVSRTALLGLVVLVTAPSNLMVVRTSLEYARTNNQYLLENYLMPPMYVSRAEYDAMVWLRDHTTPDDVVFSTNLIGNHIPVVAGNRVYIGHWAETRSIGAKLEAVMAFYTGAWPGRPILADRRELLREATAAYVWYGQYERALGPGVLPPLAEEPFLKVAYENPEVTIYRAVPLRP